MGLLALLVFWKYLPVSAANVIVNVNVIVCKRVFVRV